MASDPAIQAEIERRIQAFVDSEDKGVALIMCNPPPVDFPQEYGAVKDDIQIQACCFCGEKICRDLIHDPSNRPDVDKAIAACYPCGDRAVALSDDDDVELPDDFMSLPQLVERWGISEDAAREVVNTRRRDIKMRAATSRASQEFESSLQEIKNKESENAERKSRPDRAGSSRPDEPDAGRGHPERNG